MFDPDGVARAAERFEECLDEAREGIDSVRGLLDDCSVDADLERVLRDRLSRIANRVQAGGHLLARQLEEGDDRVPLVEEILAADEETAAAVRKAEAEREAYPFEHRQ